MKIIKSLFRKDATATVTNLELVLAYTQEDLKSFDNFSVISRIVAKKLAEELYPELRKKIMESPHFEAIINEIRLGVANKFNK